MKKQMQRQVMTMLCVSVVLLGCEDQGALREVWRQDGFSTPESVVYDAKRDALYVSNIEGEPNARDFRASVVAVSAASGKILRTVISEGLSAPKGMAVHEDTLYIADIDRLVLFDLVSGEMDDYQVDSAQFLNDVAVTDEGVVYVSDMLTGIIHRFTGNGFVTVLQKKHVGLPNGLLWWRNQLLIASWGDGIRDDFTTEVQGRLYRYEPRENKLVTMTQPTGNLDGIAVTNDGQVIVTDWIKGMILALNSKGVLEPLAVVGKGSADLAYHPPSDQIIVPMMLDNVLVGYRLSSMP